MAFDCDLFKISKRLNFGDSQNISQLKWVNPAIWIYPFPFRKPIFRIEVLDLETQGREVQAGQQGLALVTPLGRQSFPMIRFITQDIVRKGVRFICIDPRKGFTAKKADRWLQLQLQPGTDTAGTGLAKEIGFKSNHRAAGSKRVRNLCVRGL